MYYFTPAPWLSVMLLKMVQMYPAPGEDDALTRARLVESLDAILNRSQVREAFNDAKELWKKLVGLVPSSVVDLLQALKKATNHQLKHLVKSKLWLVKKSSRLQRFLISREISQLLIDSNTAYTYV